MEQQRSSTYGQIEKATFISSDTTPPQPCITKFACLTLHRNDRLRLLSFPAPILEGIKQVIQTTWYKGLQTERVYSHSYEFKMGGNPWLGQGKDGISSRILMREILAFLYAYGWILHASTDVSKKPAEKDTMIFRWQENAPPASEWMCISFDRSDRLTLIGADAELIEGFRHLLQGSKLWKSEQWKDGPKNAWEFKCRGYPWDGKGEETISTRLLLLRMLGVLENQGWTLYASVDQNVTTSENESEANAWYCVRDQAWQTGMPVLHR